MAFDLLRSALQSLNGNKIRAPLVGSVASREVGSMQIRHGGAVEQTTARAELLDELRMWERQLRLHSLEEAIRLIESDKITKVTAQHIRCIAEYDAITIEGESFFDKAFSSGKEVAACLGYAMEIGWREVLEDMLRLRLTIVTPQCAGDPPGSA